jgi:hypothetical protein
LVVPPGVVTGLRGEGWFGLEIEVLAFNGDMAALWPFASMARSVFIRGKDVDNMLSVS